MERTLILGATSAIAAEPSAIHAARGDVLHLVGRSDAKLTEVARRCGSAVRTTAIADFNDLDGNEAVVRDAMASLGGVDRVLIAHGDLGDQLASERTFVEARAILTTNFLSAVSLLIPIANAMEETRAGRI